MTEEKVIQLADAFLLKQVKRKLRLIGLKQSSKDRNEWNVVYQTTDEKGQVFDGPTIVIVNERTQTARFFE